MRRPPLREVARTHSWPFSTHRRHGGSPGTPLASLIEASFDVSLANTAYQRELASLTYRSHLVLRDLQLTQALETLLSVSVPSVGGVMTGQDVNYRSEGIRFDKRGTAAFESRGQASYPTNHAEWPEKPKSVRTKAKL